MGDEGFLMSRKTVDTLAEIKRRVLPALPRVPRNKRRVFDEVAGFPKGAGTIGTDCGCCDPTHCLTLPEEIDPSTFVPSSYKFTLPTALDCQCEESAGGEVIVRRVDATNVYESERIQCYGPTTETVPCTTKANWIWQEPEACPGDGTTTWICGDSGFGDYAWVKTAGCIDPCEDQDLTQEELVLLGGPCATIEDAGLPLIETDCVPPGGIGARWILVSVDDESCDCTPVEPDYDGTELGQLAETDCDGTTSASGEDELQDSFWRLTIGELGAYCQNSTKLEFIIGEA